MSELFNALKEINTEVGIDFDYMKDKIIQAISSVLKNSYGIHDPYVNFEEASGDLTVKVNKTVCESVDDDIIQISLHDALDIDPDAKLGDSILADVDTRKFGRIAAQTVRSVIRQGVRDGEKAIVTQKLKCYEKEMVSAKIIRMSLEKELVILKIGESETSLPKKDIKYVWPKKEGDFIKVYVSHIQTDGRYPVPIVSRSCPELISALFANEVPEIKEELISIKHVAREPGVRSKIAVESNDPAIDPVGTCIGPNGCRIKPIIEELGGEKIDVLRYREDPIEFIKAALSPASVVSVTVDSDANTSHNECTVTVPDDQLSLAIGVKGQNVKLAARLTGWKINLKPESGFYGE